MNNLEIYKKAFMDGLGVDEESIKTDMKYQDIPEWDSVGHMELIAELEDAFDISMDTDDIIDFNSFAKGIEILKKYDIEVEA